PPTRAVRGDYCDILPAAAGESSLALRDVSGDGVASGLIMLMTQTSIFATVDRTTGYMPSRVLELVNSVIKQNISRLRTDRYMSICAARLERDKMIFAGKHQDLLVWSNSPRAVEHVPPTGNWLGIVE